MDEASRRWVDRLEPGHERYHETVARLHELLHKAALHEAHRRRGQLAALRGQEFEDLAQQCADDALVNVLGKLREFKGLSRFTTWAYKFAIFEVSSKVARHAWHHHAPTAEELSWERFKDSRASPGEQVEQREQLSALSKAIEQELTPRQREVFVAIALNEVPIDVLALELGTNRNAIYKNLFDARKRLRACLPE